MAASPQGAKKKKRRNAKGAPPDGQQMHLVLDMQGRAWPATPGRLGSATLARGEKEPLSGRCSVQEGTDLKVSGAAKGWEQRRGGNKVAECSRGARFTVVRCLLAGAAKRGALAQDVGECQGDFAVWASQADVVNAKARVRDEAKEGCLARP